MRKPDATQRITIKPSNSIGKDATPKPSATIKQHPLVLTSPSKTTSPPASPPATTQSEKLPINTAVNKKPNKRESAKEKQHATDISESPMSNSAISTTTVI